MATDKSCSRFLFCDDIDDVSTIEIAGVTEKSLLTVIVVVTMKKTINRKAISAIDAVGMYDSARCGALMSMAYAGGSLGPSISA